MPERSTADKECVKLFRGISKRMSAKFRQKCALRDGSSIEGVKWDIHDKIHVVWLHLLGKQTPIQPELALDLERTQLVDEPEKVGPKLGPALRQRKVGDDQSVELVNRERMETLRQKWWKFRFDGHGAPSLEKA